jgi:hypothetical protein
MKPIQMLALEAFIVGALLVALFFLLSKLTKNTLLAVFVSGALFHIVCEATGLNAWYAKTYFS